MNKYEEINDLFTYVTEVSEQGLGTTEIQGVSYDDIKIHLDMLCHIKFGKGINEVVAYYDIYEENEEKILDLSVFTDYVKNYRGEE